MSDLPSVGLVVGHWTSGLAYEALQVDAQEKSNPKGNMGREWSLLREKVEKDRARDRWDSAIRSMEDFAIQYPDIRQDREYERELAMLKALQVEADSMFKRDMSGAQKLLSQGKVGQALTRADNARMFYPERKDLGKVFLASAVLLLVFSLLIYFLWSSLSARKVLANGELAWKSDKPD